MNLEECLDKNGMKVPDYTKDTIVDLVRALYRYSGYSHKEYKNKNIEKYIENKKHILFIVSDGMGSNLIDSLPDNMILKKNKVKNLTTVFPSTTGCVLSSIATAEYPSNHGVIGWYNYNREKNLNYCTLKYCERMTGKNLKNFNLNAKDIFPIESVINKLTRKKAAYFPKNIVDSDFSRFVCNNRIGYTNMQDAFHKFTENLYKNKDDLTFDYIYLPFIDRISHSRGVFSEEVINVMNLLDEELKKLVSLKIDDLEIVLTADHGQVNINQSDITMDFSKYNEYFYALPTIDFGTASYYVKKDKKDEFLAQFNSDFKDRMYIYETGEFINKGFFGNERLSKYMESNIGEYVSFCKKGYYFVNTIGKEEEYIGNVKGSHSGLSDEEMTIPLIVIN